ncbi:hypothetical protein NECAME_14211 [Necator americanus]|uniref:Tetratricopeptide repeat protein n=1 Tax=Necator americanus TaxID=51031 RepID=W2SP78_NECAM|nr:hypothetical protein NECAME_14211 [Necator americanus]ETN71450.1 hypothetical protein NECAME_14211 [Necator americanus]
MDYSDNLLKTIATVHFYLREACYGTALKICNGSEAGNPHILLLKGITLNLSEKAAEAMRLLESLRGGDYALGALHALKQSHNMAENPDRQSLQELESAISALGDVTVMGHYSAAEVLFFMKEYNQAKPILDRIVKTNPENVLITCLSGWTEIYLRRDQKSTIELFEQAIAGRYLDGYVGKMTVLAARQLANDMKALGKSDNVLIQFLLAVYSICSAGTKIESSLSDLQKFQAALDSAEGDNHVLLANMASALYRMAARNRTVLAFARELLARANKKYRRHKYVVDELRVAISLDDVREVTAKVKELMSLDSDDPYAVLGVALSNLMTGQVDDASTQLTFMKEANPNISNFTIYHFVSAAVAKYKDNSYEKFMQMVNDCIAIHFDKLQAMPYGVEYLRTLDSDFLMGIVYQIMDYAPLVVLEVDR